MSTSKRIELSLSACLVLLLLGLLPFGPAEAAPPKDPLVVPLGRSDGLWEMEELSPGKAGGSVKYSTENFPKTFNDLLANSKASTDVTRVIMGAGLVSDNPVNGRVTPALAKSWSVSEDGLSYTFHLREGLKFSDGQPLTAEDVVFTYEELAFNPEVNTEKRDLLRIENQLPDVEKVDELTVRFTLPKPYGPFLRLVSTGIYPKHELEGIDGEEFNELWGKETAKSEPGEIVGAGPFKLEEFVPGEEIVMGRNPHYYKTDPEGKRLPYLDGYRVFKVEDDDVQFLKFKNGDTDLLRPQIEDMPFLLSRHDEGGWNVNTGSGETGAPMSADFLTFNWGTEDEELAELFATPEFRRAVSLMIDRKKIIDEVFNSFGKRQFGPISRYSPYHKKEMREVLPYDFDPERGEELLAELEITDVDGDGSRELPSGEPVEFGILVNEENRARRQMGEIISEGLGRVGVEAEVRAVEFGEFSSRLVQGNYQAAIASFLTNPAIPSTLSDVFTTSGPLHVWHRGGRTEPAAWEKEVDGLFRQGLRAPTFEERKKYYDRFQEIYAEKLPIVYLAGESFLYATDEDLRNTEKFSRLGTFLDFAEYVWVER